MPENLLHVYLSLRAHLSLSMLFLSIKLYFFLIYCSLVCSPESVSPSHILMTFKTFALLFLTAKCIDHYTKLRVENAELPEDEEKKTIDPRLEGIVNKMFQRCLDDHKYKQAIGIALETRRLDVFEKTILESVKLELFIK